MLSLPLPLDDAVPSCAGSALNPVKGGRARPRLGTSKGVLLLGPSPVLSLLFSGLVMLCVSVFRKAFFPCLSSRALCKLARCPAAGFFFSGSFVGEMADACSHVKTRVVYCLFRPPDQSDFSPSSRRQDDVTLQTGRQQTCMSLSSGLVSGRGGVDLCGNAGSRIKAKLPSWPVPAQGNAFLRCPEVALSMW